MADVLHLPAETRAGLYDPFAEGGVLRHPDGTIVRFADDVWTTHPAGRSKSHSFMGVAGWMKPLAKRVLAHAWLVEDRPAGSLRSYAWAARTASEVLSHFHGPVQALTPDHAEHVRSWVVGQWEARERARFELGKELGREPRQKEVRVLFRQDGTGLGERSSRAVVSMLRKVVKAAEVEGLQIDCRFTFPKLIAKREIAIGSASAEKLLSAEELGSLITAAMADIDDYQQLADEVYGQVRRYMAVAEDPKAILGGDTRSSKAARRLQRYFGLHDSPMQSSKQIAREEGVSPAGFTRTLRRALARSVGSDDAARLMEIRKRAVRQGIAGIDDEDRAAARAELREYFDRHPLDLDVSRVSLKDGAATIAKLFGLDGPLHSLSDADVPSNGMLWARMDPLSALIHGKDAKRQSRHLWNRRNLLSTYLDRAIKACGLLLQIVCYRRVAALIDSLDANLEGQWVTVPNGDRIFELDFTAGKMWGPRGLPEKLPVPGYFGDVAEKALMTAKDLTRPLRSYAAPEHRDALLLTRGPGMSWLEPTVVLPASLGEYLRTETVRDGGGLVNRRGLEGLQHVTLHVFRHTAATSIITRGGSAIAAADLLGNSPEMAGKYYFVGGSGEERDQAKAAAERNATTGFLTDAVVRVAEGPNTDEAYPSQLPYDVALKRVQDTPEFVQDYLSPDGEFGPEQARTMLRAGLVINLTRWGGCVLPAEEGPCPAVHSCPVGCDPQRNQEDPNSGCRWGVKVPHTEAIATYENELAIMQAQREEMGTQERFRAFAGPLAERILIHSVQLETLYQLRDSTTVRAAE